MKADDCCTKRWTASRECISVLALLMLHGSATKCLGRMHAAKFQRYASCGESVPRTLPILRVVCMALHAGSPTDAATAALCYTSLAAAASTTSNCPTAASAAAAASNAASIAADRAGSEPWPLSNLTSVPDANLQCDNRLIFGSRKGSLLLAFQHGKAKLCIPSDFSLPDYRSKRIDCPCSDDSSYCVLVCDHGEHGN